jgi:hypothetical protein
VEALFMLKGVMDNVKRYYQVVAALRSWRHGGQCGGQGAYAGILR